MSFGLNEKGFVRKRYADVWEDMAKTARTIFGEDVNLQENSPLGMFIRLNAWEIATAWQVAEDVYYSAFVDFAEGHQLDLVCQYIGIRRTAAQPAQGTIKFTGTLNGTIIPVGTKVQTVEGIVFETVEETFLSSGEATAKIEAVEPGEGGNLQAGTITEMVDTIEGINDEVLNEAPTAEGRESETDHDLRTRYKRSVQNPGQATAGAVEAAIMDIPEVWDAYVRENDTDSPVPVGDVTMPIKSIYPLVHYGDDAEIARKIYETKAAGIQSFAPEESGVVVQVEDTRGVTHPIGFDRPDEIYICVDATLETDESFGGTDAVEEAIETYLNSRGIARDVIYTRLIATAQNFTGVKDVSELLLYQQAKVDVTANSGAKVKVRAAFIDGFKGVDGNDESIGFTDSTSGGLSVSYTANTITVNFGGETSMTALELKELVDSLDEFEAVVKTAGNFTVADDITVSEALADGAVTECENVSIDFREVSIPLHIEVGTV